MMKKLNISIEIIKKTEYDSLSDSHIYTGSIQYIDRINE